jgi:hypothetical protein
VLDAGESTTSPNVNCLDGKCCPSCGSYGPFEVVVSKRILLYDNGTDESEDGTTEYGDDAPTTCYSCQFEGRFDDFDE